MGSGRSCPSPGRSIVTADSNGSNDYRLQITLNSGRSTELKQRFYKTLADRLHEGVKIRKEDVLINLVEISKENWSFGNGEAQYVTPPK